MEIKKLNIGGINYMSLQTVLNERGLSFENDKSIIKEALMMASSSFQNGNMNTWTDCLNNLYHKPYVKRRRTINIKASWIREIRQAPYPIGKMVNFGLAIMLKKGRASF